MSLSVAKLLLDSNGVPRGVYLDGNLMPNVAAANVVVQPDEVTKLHLVISVSTVTTERFEEG